jgi:hypothetical protein
MTTLPNQTDHPDTRLLADPLDPITNEVPTLKVSVLARLGAQYDLVLELASGFDQVVGRDASADITVPDQTMSRRHARISHNAEGVWLQDLGSTNGTWVNGHRLLDRCPLRDGDQVKIGNAEAIFHDVVSAPDSTKQLQVVPATKSTPLSMLGRETEMLAPGVRCPSCSADADKDAWFCHHCGYQQRPIAVQLAAPEQVQTQSVRETVIGPHGNMRSRAFRHVMRSRNGGRRPLYNATLVMPALVLRIVIAAALLLAVVAAFVVLGLGVHHFVELRQQTGRRPIARHSHSLVPSRFHAQMGGFHAHM